MHCTTTRAYIFFRFTFMISHLSKYFFTRISHIYCFDDFFSSSSVRSLGINFDSQFKVGFVRSVRTHTTSSACLTFFKTQFSAFPKTHRRKVSYISYLITTPLIHPTLVFSNKITCHRVNHKFLIFATTILSLPSLSITIGNRHCRCFILLLFLGGHLTHSLFIICPHCGICLIIILD